jgi:hypothetical protein
MLISNESVKYGACDIVNKEITQEVIVTSENESYKLAYSLSLNNQKLGIESATVRFSEPEVSA